MEKGGDVSGGKEADVSGGEEADVSGGEEVDYLMNCMMKKGLATSGSEDEGVS